MRFAIVCGSNKCGTTSLFRYLSDHPAVRPSRRKELRFFSTARPGSREEILEDYYREFIANKPSATTLLEATPQYLHVGRERAAMIRAIVPSARLLFILRDPVDRLVSYFRSAIGQVTRPSYGFTFEQVVDLGLAGLAGMDQSSSAKSFAQEIRMANYARYLEEYSEIWPREQLRIIFFDQLVARLRGEMIDVAHYLDLDARFYDDYIFEVENRTRGHRLPGLQRVALRINAVMEPFMAGRLGLRRWARGIYNRLNESETHVLIEGVAIEKLRAHYAPTVQHLRHWMAKTFPNQALPHWL